MEPQVEKQPLWVTLTVLVIFLLILSVVFSVLAVVAVPAAALWTMGNLLD